MTEPSQIADSSPLTVFSSWRPALSWIIVVGFFLQFIVLPVVNIYLAVHGKTTFTGLDTSSLVGMASAGLGLGGLRTYEKINNIAQK